MRQRSCRGLSGLTQHHAGSPRVCVRCRNTACTSSACPGSIWGPMAGREVARVAACHMTLIFRSPLWPFFSSLWISESWQEQRVCLQESLKHRLLLVSWPSSLALLCLGCCRHTCFLQRERRAGVSPTTFWVSLRQCVVIADDDGGFRHAAAHDAQRHAQHGRLSGSSPRANAADAYAEGESLVLVLPPVRLQLHLCMCWDPGITC